MRLLNQKQVHQNMRRRLRKNAVYTVLFIACTLFSLLMLALLLYRIIGAGLPYLDGQFLTSFASRNPERAGIAAALWGTVALAGIVTPLSLLLGVGTALYLEEYAKKTTFTRFIELNLQTLSGVPSVVFGLLGLTVFVYAAGLGQSILAGGLTMTLLVLPTIVVASQEALRAVPPALREASYGMGATKWQTMYHVVLPAAFSGILTGCILALSRALGEAAPLLVVGALAFMNYIPASLLDEFTVLPIQIFNWMGRAQEEFQQVAAAGIVALMGLLLLMNSLAAWLRSRGQQKR
ncbi:phosphate ABC transporter permease PstA [Ectobacillus ponti]|uniref:Phosphate transport system permease protein PstA n=1 Tax=Ectobacillus ponti TaxID=2961894 RepID=A0AA42BN59_9BACI|nr:phosphate ABC transporter permease PstA [Ectobacillus ponti]MCP8967136.1 phosphate ABC transporter permease PstA [Ectobacillus ponti]